MTRRHEKLIRDGIPVLAAREGRALRVREAGAGEVSLLLSRKIVEEGAEVHEALRVADREALVEELGDLQTVLDEIARRAGISAEEIRTAVYRKGEQRGGFTRGLVLSEEAPRPARLHTGRSATLLETLRHELAECRSASLAVSFILGSGLDALEGALRAALLRGVTLRILTTDYLDVTEPEALRRLLALPGRLDLRVFSHPSRSFHPKAYLFDHGDGAGRAFVGSANLSRSGLAEGVEWTWRIDAADLGHPMDELFGQFDELFTSTWTQVPDPSWIDAYAARRQPRPLNALESLYVSDGPRPRPVQTLALAELARLREEGERRALVIAATGLGKTWLAAFDAREFRRVLFIAHRDELLRHAQECFLALYPHRTAGFVAGERIELDADMVFASVQTLSRERLLGDPRLAEFDYVVVDEFHHAAAPSYVKVLDRIAPRFLLGLTATPYRGDNRDLYALCDGNVAYEVRLFQAIAFGWLTPFRYIGLADPVDYDSSLLNASRSGYDVTRLEKRYADPVRTECVIGAFRAHAGRASLGFCVSITHAEAMAQAFRDAGFAALAVHSRVDMEVRRHAVARLERGEVQILFTVDLFNEGVDIPCIDLVLFLRPTDSMTVFLQQLGRGLRLHAGKERLTVIDLIGNHRKAQFKLPFLVGVEDDSPEALREALRGVRGLLQGKHPTDLPEGVEVELEELAVDHLERALRAADGLRPQLVEAFEEVCRGLGRRPSLRELEVRGRFAAQQYLRQFGGWFGTLRAVGQLREDEAALDVQCGAFLRELETASMTRSYKMVTVMALLEREGLPGAISVEDLSDYFRRHFAHERHRYDIAGTRIEDIGHVAREPLARYIVDNPINAWVGGNRSTPSPYFAYDASRRQLRYIGPSPADRELFQAAVRERVEYRLHRYEHRSDPSRRVYSVIPNGSGACIMLGHPRGDGLPRGAGWQLVRFGGSFLYAKFAKVAINVLKRNPVDAATEPNILTECLCQLFRDDRLLEFRRGYGVMIARREGVWEVSAMSIGADANPVQEGA